MALGVNQTKDRWEVTDNFLKGERANIKLRFILGLSSYCGLYTAIKSVRTTYLSFELLIETVVRESASNTTEAKSMASEG